MKILFPIGSYFPSQDGGPSNTVYWICKQLIKEGFSITVTTTTSGIENVCHNKWIDTEYGRVIYIKSRFHFFPLKLILTSIREVRRHEIIHLSSIFYPLSMIMYPVALFYRKKIIWSSHGELDDGALIYKSFIKKIILFTLRIILNDKVLFHTTSPQESIYIRKNLSTNIRVVEIANFMELPTLVSCTVKNQFLYLGRIHPKKNILELIRALTYSELFLRSDFKLIIAGNNSNPYGDLLKEKVSEWSLNEKVYFIGLKTGEEKELLYASSYFTLLPSITENFGIVVIESLAQCTPVIASKGTPWDILEKQKAGFWVESSAQSLSTAIGRALTLSKEEYSIYRNNSLELTRFKFDICTNINKWVELYRNLK